MFNIRTSNLVNLLYTVQRRSVSQLKALLAEQIPKEQERIKKFRKASGKQKIGEVTIDMVYGGMRGVKGLLCETSLLDANEGIKFRGYTIPECQKLLPKADCGEQPLPEGIFWLLITGCIPGDEEVKSLSEEWADRASLPDYVCCFLDEIPKHVHPMAQFSAACSILSTQSHFVKAYHQRVNKNKYWEATYEDVMDLIARVPAIAARIYRNTFDKGRLNIEADPCKDWSHNFCTMLGFDDPGFVELMRLYLTIHCDHEGGNVSAHATHLVGSALSDPYLAYASGMNGLAGPLHGLANQEALMWLLKLREELGDSPSEDQVKEFVEESLKTGVVPGYGHAVLRKTDPRFTCQRDYAAKHFPDDPLCRIVAIVFKVVPPILQGLGKVQNPWPNVDAHSGVLLQYYGMTEMNYYTVLFGVSRALGVLASLVWDRALGLPIERPKSFTTDDLMEMVKYTEK